MQQVPRQAVRYFLGPSSVPQDIRDMRESSFDLHNVMGSPVIHKHRWNERDVQKGLTIHCPVCFNVSTRQGRQWDPYCFGTGYLGGFADGIVTFVVIADVTEDVIKITPQGLLLKQRNPGFTAPWFPKMGDGDILLTGEFDTETLQLTDPEERYILQEVIPTTIHGYRGERRNQSYSVGQRGQIDFLPWEHQFYNVPVKFDYDSVPVVPLIPPGGDPNDFPPEAGTFTSFTTDVRIIGIEGQTYSLPIGVSIFGAGISSNISQDIRLIGKSFGSHIFLD